MVYKHKIRVSHILDDLERGYIKNRDTFKEAMNQLEKEDFINHFLEEYDENKKEEEETQEVEEPLGDSGKPEDEY